LRRTVLIPFRFLHLEAVDFLQAISRALPCEDEAACRDAYDGSTRGTWIIEPTAELTSPQSVASKLEVCDGCTVRADCLRFALTAELSVVGIWGRSSTIERTTLAPRLEGRLIERAHEILTETHTETPR
jgi:hypothetical protein